MNNCGLDQISRIILHMGDEYSKEMYAYRLMYSLDRKKEEPGSEEWIRKIIAMTEEGKHFNNILEKYKDRDKVIFGAGFWGMSLLKYYSDIKWSCFVDNDKSKTVLKGLKILAADELLSYYHNPIIVIATRLYHSEIKSQLISMGITEDCIVDFGKMVDDMFQRQYFDLPFLVHSEDEIFVDVGCLDGLSSVEFAKWSEGKYKKIYAFEPDSINIKRCQNIFQNVKNSTVFNYGLWDKSRSLRFSTTASGISSITDNGASEIQVVALDDILKDEKITFIKMDIEGAELNALKGAETIIKKYKPQIAVSLYHKFEDVWEIPDLLLQYNSDYTFYLRHYSFEQAESVLYAI